MNNRFYRTSWFDLVLIFAVLTFCVASIVGILPLPWINSPPADQARVFHSSDLLLTVDLQKDSIIPILGGKMRLEVKAGRIRVLESDCPGHVCVHTGWIERTGQTIVCVPNHVLVELKSRSPALVDAVVK